MSEHQVSNRNRRSIPQLDRLCALLGPVLEHNAFYRQKLNAAGIQRPEDIDNLAAYGEMPFTTRAELSNDQMQHPPYGSNLTFPAETYTRIHQTSGTTGQRLRWLDTAVGQTVDLLKQKDMYDNTLIVFTSE